MECKLTGVIELAFMGFMECHTVAISAHKREYEDTMGREGGV